MKKRSGAGLRSVSGSISIDRYVGQHLFVFSYDFPTTAHRRPAMRTTTAVCMLLLLLPRWAARLSNDLQTWNMQLARQTVLGVHKAKTRRRVEPHYTVLQGRTRGLASGSARICWRLHRYSITIKWRLSLPVLREASRFPWLPLAARSLCGGGAAFTAPGIRWRPTLNFVRGCP